MTLPLRFLSVSLLAAALSACSPEPTPAPAPAAPAPETADVPDPAATPGSLDSGVAIEPPLIEDEGIIRADPLDNCDAAQVATVYWTREAVADGGAMIEIEGSASRSVFATVGAAGSKRTGPWARPGMVLVVRGVDRGEARGRVTLRGPGC